VTTRSSSTTAAAVARPTPPPRCPRPALPRPDSEAARCTGVMDEARRTRALSAKRFRCARSRTPVSAYLREDGTKISKKNELQSSRRWLRGQELTSWSALGTSSPGGPKNLAQGLHAWCQPTRGLPHLDPPPQRQRCAPPTAQGLTFRPSPRPRSVLGPRQWQGKLVRPGLRRPG
jgi:hypothetical protein